MSDIQIEILDTFKPILYHSYYYSFDKSIVFEDLVDKDFLEEYKNKNKFPIDTMHLHGGRGSGKSINVYLSLLLHTFHCDHDILLIRWIQSSIRQSSHSQLKELINKYRLNDYFTITNIYIQNNISNARIEFKGLYGNLDNIRSLSESFKVIVLEECQAFHDSELQALLATIYRFEGLLLITIQNVFFYSNPVYQRLIVNDDSPYTRKYLLNWYDNKFFNDGMKRQMEQDKRLLNPSVFEATWNGVPMKSLQNAIYTEEMIAILNKSVEEGLPDLSEFDKIIVSLDPAVSDKKVSEEDQSNSNAIIVVGLSKLGNVHIIDIWSEVSSPDICVSKCVEFYDKYKCDYILFEENQGGNWIKSMLLSKSHTLNVVPFRSIANKVQRASQLSIPILNNRIKISPYLKTNDYKIKLIDQMQRMTNTGLLQKYSNESPDLLDALGFSVINLLRLNQRGTYNGVLPLTTTIGDAFLEHNIKAIFNEGNIMYGIDIEIKSKADQIYVLVKSIERELIDKYEINVDKSNILNYLFLPNIKININGIENINNMITIDKLPFSCEMLPSLNIPPIQIDNNEILDIWNNFDNTKDNDSIYLKLLLYIIKNIS